MVVAGILQSAGAREVEFRFSAPQGTATVAVVGQFNEWDRARHPLRQEAGEWRAKVAIEPGVYQYLFVLDGKKWVRDPAAPTASDANGNTNSKLIVEPADYDDAPAVPGDVRVTVSALRHRPDTRDTVRKNRTEVLLKLRTRKGDVGKVEVLPEGGAGILLKMARTDELYDYWQGAMYVPPKGEFSYRFLLDEGRRYGAGGLGEETAPFVQRPRDLPLPELPQWLEGAVFYQVFPDRFENGDTGNDPPGTEAWGSPPTPSNWLGGDLAGVEKRLGHLRALGVTGLYLNPIFKTQSNHGYTTDDYRRIDPRFGDEEGLRRLVAASKGQGMRLVLDGVFNHAGTGYAPFRSVVEQGEASPFRHYFHVLKLPLEVREGQQTYGTFAGVWQMPKLATHEPAVQQEVAAIGAHWIQEYGVGGWRLDVADEVDAECWRAFRRAVKSADPDAYIVGEVWGDAHEWLQGDMFDGVMNYRWREAVLGFVSGSLPVSGLADRLKLIEEDYPDAVAHGLLNVLGSHDTERLRRIVPDRSRRMAAAAIQFTWPGVPCVYYGDEVGLDGGRDPDDRRCMDWDEATWDLELLAHYRTLSGLRSRHAALQRGRVTKMTADDKNGLFAFRRDEGPDQVWVVVNMGKRTMDQPLGAGSWKIAAGEGEFRGSSVEVAAGMAAVLVRGD